jgi:hypothetical protein
MIVTEERIIATLSEAAEISRPSPRNVTEVGMEMEVRPPNWNALLPSIRTEVGICRDFREVVMTKPFWPIEVTVVGMVTD